VSGTNCREGLLSKDFRLLEKPPCPRPFNTLKSDAEPYRKNGSNCCTKSRLVMTMMTMTMTMRRRKTRRTANHSDRTNSYGQEDEARAEPGSQTSGRRPRS
jgi:hypothetical protein